MRHESKYSNKVQYLGKTHRVRYQTGIRGEWTMLEETSPALELTRKRILTEAVFQEMSQMK